MEETFERPLKIIKSSKIAAGVIDLTGTEDENYVNGGILSNSKVSWVSCGSRLTTINCDNGSKRTGWTFGWALQDPMYKIVCVEELPNKSGISPILIVACESETTGSSLCFYHSGSSRVLKAVHFTDKITSLSVVSKSNESEKNISNLLRPWNGIVAVGTYSGKVYLVDVWFIGLEKCMDDYQHKHYDEQRQSKITEISVGDLKNNDNLKNNSVRHGSSTLALWLNEETLLRGSRVQNVLGRMPREFLAVSALKYFPQISMLAVGYNTSCFQLWNLKTLTVQYTSPLLEAMLPVCTFSLLEPSDDPRFVCYLWSLHHSVDEDSIPFAGMYLLSFREKRQNNYNTEHLYEGFSSCSICYQLDLGNEIENVLSGRIISCQSIHRANAKPSPLWLETGVEEGSPEDTVASLLAIVWEVWTPDQLGVYRRLTLFDLNQWYREYMPHSSDINYSHFMTHFCLPDGPLLTAKVLPHTVKQFVTLQPVDEHFYPSGTSFQCVCLEQSRVLICAHLGLQQECLQAIQEEGPSALLLPSRLYKLCLQAGIKPLLGEVGSPSSSRTKEQREWVLSAALEYGMIQYLRNCVRDWADGSHAVADCTLPSLLQWAWGRVQQYKKWLDRLCVPLFDYSGTALDSNNLGIFHHVIALLHCLHNLFRLVLEKYRNCILQDSFEQQIMAINLVTTYYDSVLWCVKHKILPETDADDSHYFTEKIVSSTITRRVEVHQIAKSLKHPAPTSGLLLIDALIAQEAQGTKLTDQWEREGGGATLGKYPPPSIQSLLRTYLVRGIPVHIKHSIVSYFLHDVIHILSGYSLSEDTKQKLINYGSDFGLTESQCKIIHAFWCLDHKNFEEGVSLLLDSCVNREDIQVYQHRTIISLLTANGHHKLALHYLNVRRPGLVEHQDIKMKMTLLLVNNLIHEAFELQRQHHKALSAELLQQFFTGCVEMNKLDIVFKLPLNIVEEEAFMSFLEKSTHPQADDLRVLYLLSRSRYIEAIDMNEKLRAVSGTRRGTSSFPLGYSPLGSRSKNLFGPRDELTGAPTKAVLTTRDLIINSVAKSLPSVTRELADLCSKEKNFNWKQVERPAPLSVVVHTAFNNERLPFYKMTNSLLVETALSKTRETWAPLLATPAALKRKLASAVEDTPFLRTPLIPRLNTSVSNYSPFSESRSDVNSRIRDFSLSTKRAKLEISPITEKESLTGDWSFNKDMTCPENSALLHTPLVARTIKQKAKETTTPHSILKSRSNANTPNTPARGEKSVGSPAVTRQIRFSLPNDKPVSKSSPRVKDEEESDYSPSISPRKSIHDLSSIRSRKSTPANPRISRKPLRSVVTSLKFDDEETVTEKIRPEQSATAAALLKKISSSSISSDETYFSSSSKGTKSRESELSFQLPLGLEGNMEFSDDEPSQQEELNLTEDQEIDAQTDIVEPISKSSSPYLKSSVSDDKTVKPNIVDRSKTIDIVEGPTSKTSSPDLKSSVSDDKTIEPSIVDRSKTIDIVEGPISKTSSPDSKISVSDDKTVEPSIVDRSKTIKESICEIPDNIPKKVVKIVVESSSGARRVKKPAEVYDTSEESFEEANSSLEMEVEENETYLDSDSTNKTPIFKWTKEAMGENSETLKLQVNKHNDKGVEKCVATVTLSEEMPMFYLEPKDELEETQVLSTITETIQKEVVTNKPQFKDKEEEKVFNDNIVVDAGAPLSMSKEISKLSKPNEINDLNELKSYDSVNVTESNILEKAQSPQDSSDVASIQDISIEGTPLPQVLEEILKRGRISSSPKDRPKLSLSDNIDIKDNLKDVAKGPDNDDSGALVEDDNLNNHGISNLVSVSNETFTSHGISNVVPVSNETFTVKEIINDIEQEKTESISLVEHEVQSTINMALSTSAETTDEPNALQVETFEHKPSCGTGEGIDVELTSESQSNIINSSGNTEPQEVIICQNTPGNNQISDNTYVLEPANIRSSSPCIVSELAEDSAANIELQISESDSMKIYKKNDEEAVEEEPVYETLATVEFETDDNDVYMNASFEEEYNQEKEDDFYEEDIYGDIQEDEALSEEEEEYHEQSDSNNENEEEERNSDVICLDSSTNEESPKDNLTKFSSHQQRTTKFSKSPKIADETLDYEDDHEESENERAEEDDEEDMEEIEDEEIDYSESIRDNTEESSSDKEEHNRLSFDDFSDSEEGHHGNRSWKSEVRVTGSYESLDKTQDVSEEEDTIESPPFEIIGQDSQLEENIEVKVSDRNLETIVEETSNNTSVEDQTSNSVPISYETTSGGNVTKNQTQNEFTEVQEVNKNVFHENKNSSDTIKFQEQKQKQLFETGSISDLKKRRSKRYSSATDLSLNKISRSRRRSCSFHDFESMIISETKSAKTLSMKEISEPTIYQEQIIENSSENGGFECSSVNKTNIVSSTTSTSNEPIIHSQDCAPSEGISSKASSLCVEHGSISSFQLQENSGMLGLTTAKVVDFTKTRGKSITGRFCSSLQNISEEISFSSGISGNNSHDSPLRRSLSNNDIAEHGHFEELPRRASSVSRWSEYLKAHESKMNVELNDSSLDNMDTPAGITTEELKKSQSNKSRSFTNISSTSKDHSLHFCDNDFKKSPNPIEPMKHTFSRDKNDEQDKIVMAQIVSSQNVISSDSSDLEASKTNHMDRSRRGQSEPLSSSTMESHTLTKKRRSSSLLKIQNIHRKVFPMHSLRRSSHKISYEPLEIVNSDEDSFTESGKTESNPVSKQTKDSIRMKNVEEPPQQKLYISTTGDTFHESEKPSGSINHEIEERVPQEIDPTQDEISVNNLQASNPLSNSKNKQRSQSEPPSLPENLKPRITRRSSSTLKINRLHNLVLSRHSLRRSTLRKSSFQPLEIIQSDEEKSFNQPNSTSPEKNVSDSENKNIESVINKEDDFEKNLASHVIPKTRGKRQKTTLSSKDKQATDIEKINETEIIDSEMPSEVNDNKNTEDGSGLKKEATASQVTNKKRGRKRKNLLSSPKENNLDNAILDSQNNRDIVKTFSSESPHEIESNNKHLVKNTRKIQKRGRKRINSSKTKADDSVSKTEENKTDITSSSQDEKLQHLPEESIDKGKTITTEMDSNSKKESKSKTRKTKVTEKCSEDDETTGTIILRKREANEDNISIPKKKRNDTDTNKEIITNKTKKNQINDTPKVDLSPDSSLMETSVTSSHINETPKKSNKNINLEQNLFDSPARRTRRSMSRVSDTELITPVLEAKRRTRRSGAMSDIVTPSKSAYAESEASDASTSSKLKTPTRRSLRRQSFTATPGTPDLVPEDYLLQRRLTRNQHAQLQKSFELSFKDSPRISKLEDLPEESAEAEGSTSDLSMPSTPVRSSSRNLNKTTPKYLSKQSKSKTANK